jgi:hypothetical protein
VNVCTCFLLLFSSFCMSSLSRSGVSPSSCGQSAPVSGAPDNYYESFKCSTAEGVVEQFYADTQCRSPPVSSNMVSPNVGVCDGNFAKHTCGHNQVQPTPTPTSAPASDMAIGGFVFTLYESLANCTRNVNVNAQATYNAAGKRCQSEVAQAEHYFMVCPEGMARAKLFFVDGGGLSQPRVAQWLYVCFAYLSFSYRTCSV